MITTTTKLTIIAAALLLTTSAHAAGTAINETGEMPDASAILDARSLTKGFLPPRMTAAQKNAISSPATGLMVYQTDGTAGIYLYNGSAWKQVLSGPAIQATGTATVANVLSGSTFSNAAATGLTGTMTNNGAVTITPGATAQTIPAGYHNGSGTVATDAALVTGNIKSGATIFGVAGTSTVMETNTGTAAAGNILTGKTAFVNGVTVTGTVAAGANVAGTNGVKVITIPAGLYAGTETATAADTSLVTGNIKSGATIFGVAGTSTVMDTSTGTAAAGDILTAKTAFVNGATVTGTVAAGANVTGSNAAKVITIPDGLYAGSKTATASDTNLLAANIKSGTTIFGVTGTAAVATYPAPVPKSGQTTSYAANDDGALKKGVVTPNPRFTINAGTVTDNLTGLIWLQNASCAGAARTWTTALNDVASLNSAGTMNNLNCGDTSNGGSRQTDWRLPTIKELLSLVDYGYSSPPVSNTAGTAKWSANDPFTAVKVDVYWSSTTYANFAGYAWVVGMAGGYISGNDKVTSYYVWPVRGGQ